MTSLSRYSPWFYAAAAYNALAGSAVALLPRETMALFGMQSLNSAPMWQVMGMFVAVYAPAYWWAARNPAQHPKMILIGLLGKVLGPVGFVFSWLQGTLPLQFGLLNVFNDLIWWVPFAFYLRDVAKADGGWKKIVF